MSGTKLDRLTIDQLVDRFAEIGGAQDEALFNDQYAKFNRLFDKMKAVDDELRRRGRDARLALQKLYGHPNLQVRLQAAKWTLGVAPVEARRVIQQIYDWKLYPQAGDAGMCLSNLDDGTFKPD
ncbi:MAG: DUF2019 domain-containing protein [Beijerinckiaceae bacterium]